MKNLLIIGILLAVFTGTSYSQVDIGLRVGLSTPNDRINDVYNKSLIKVDKFEDVYGNLKREATSSGYHIGLTGRISLMENFMFVGGLTYHKFPKTNLVFENLASESLITESIYESSQSFITLSAGVNYYFVKSTLGIYGVGELQYNYLSSDLDFVEGIDIEPPSLNPTDSRVGAGLGAGVDLDLKLVKLSLEGKYNFANLVGMEETESSKNFFSLSFCVFL